MKYKHNMLKNFNVDVIYLAQLLLEYGNVRYNFL